MSGPYNDPCFPPVRAASPQIIRHTPAVVESRQYLAELIAEDQKLGPFMQVLPVCGHLLNQGHKGNDHLTSSSPSSGLSPAVCSGFREILRVSGIFPNQGFREFGGLRYGSPSPLASPGTLLNFSGAGGLGGWSSPLQEEESIRGRPRYENLNDPLHISIEAKLPGHVVDKRLRQAEEVIEGWLKPMGDSQDCINTRQLQELTLPNSSFGEERPGPSGSFSSFNTSGMKRAKMRC